MKLEIFIEESSVGFWNSITADSIVTSIITVLGIFASSYFTYIVMKRQQHGDILLNHKEFYDSAINYHFWLQQLIDRFKKILEISNYEDKEKIKHETEFLDLVIERMHEGLKIDSAPYQLKNVILEIDSASFQTLGYLKRLLKVLEDESEKKLEHINPTDFLKERRKIIRKNVRIIKKYL